MSDQGSKPPPSNVTYAETIMNLALLDPPRWGWTAAGGIADVLTPHERARRRETKKAFLQEKKRQRELGRLKPQTNPKSSLQQSQLPKSSHQQSSGGQEEKSPAVQPRSEKSESNNNDEENIAAPSLGTETELAWKRAATSNGSRLGDTEAVSQGKSLPDTNVENPISSKPDLQSNFKATAAQSKISSSTTPITDENGNQSIANNRASLANGIKTMVLPDTEKRIVEKGRDQCKTEGATDVMTDKPTMQNEQGEDHKLNDNQGNDQVGDLSSIIGAGILPPEIYKNGSQNEMSSEGIRSTGTNADDGEMEVEDEKKEKCTKDANSKDKMVMDGDECKKLSSETTITDGIESAISGEKNTPHSPSAAEVPRPPAQGSDENDSKREKNLDQSTKKVVALDASTPTTASTSPAASSQPTKPEGGDHATETKTVEGNHQLSSEDSVLAAQQQTKNQSSVAADDDDDANMYETGSDPDNKVLKIGALKDGNLDIYAYHRGREGMEPRNPNTGELLCDVEQTDSNYRWDEPRLVFPVTISFPLIDHDEQVGKDASNVPMYEDTITWNLRDPETPPPMAFATSVAEEFGLSFAQTIDLAASVEEQIYKFLRENAGYAVPVALNDGTGSREVRKNFPPSEIPHLYGEVNGNAALAGTKFKTATSALVKSKSTGRSGTGRASAVGAQGSTSRRRSDILDDSSSTLPTRREPPTMSDDEDPLEDVYIQEVHKRMIEASKANIVDISNSEGRPLGHVELQKNEVCHICHKRHDLCGLFACRKKSHSYCKNHLRNRLDLEVNGFSDEVTLDFCPICSATCLCAKCGRRQTSLALELRNRTKEQGTDADKTEFDDIFTIFKNTAFGIHTKKVAPKRRNSVGSLKSEPSAPSNLSENTPKKTPPLNISVRNSSVRWGEEAARKHLITKVPFVDFPREFRNGVDVDPATVTDYLTVHTEEKSYVKEPELIKKPSKLTANRAVATEDGSVSQCIKCKDDKGVLACCDFCPRAWHLDCLPEGEVVPETAKWECHCCREERKGLPEFTLSGSDSHSTICAVYGDLESDGDDLKQMETLSKIHEMVLKLISTPELGGMFAQPVDPIYVPDYPKIIKEPMDLGTIGSMLANGDYIRHFQKKSSWDDLHFAVLKDIELVWHNCFTYNCEGSAIYRMAEVLRRRMMAMRTRSLDKVLSDDVKQRVDEYVEARGQERGKFSSSILSVSDIRPVSRYKVETTFKRKAISRSKKIAVYDPDTGMLAKVYCSLNSAFKAAQHILQQGYTCELNISKDSTFKSLLHKMDQDPSLRIFGYRWLDLDRLRAREVAFTAPSACEPPKTPLFEMVDNESRYFFLTANEALSCLRLNSASEQELLKALRELPETGESIEISGVKWRKRKSRLPKMLMNGTGRVGSYALSPFWENEEAQVEQDALLPVSCTIAKEDLITRRLLAGFESLDAAFHDWQFTCEGSATVLADQLSRANFHIYYLDGDRNVDGVVWKIVERTSSDVEAMLEPSAEFSEGSEGHSGDEVNCEGSMDVDKECEDAVDMNSKASPVSAEPRQVISVAKRGRMDEADLKPNKRRAA